MPSRREGRGIALITLLFVVLSGVLHMILGGMFHQDTWVAAPAPSVTTLGREHLETLPPAPSPTPRPSPTLPPKLIAVTPSPAARATSIVKPIAPPHPPIAPPLVRSTDGAGGGTQTSRPATAVSPQPSAPADYRYVVVSARFINRVQPVYPEEAARAGEEGSVIVVLTIGPDGVSDVRIWESSGYPDLDREALRAAKESTYSIPEVNGEPVTETYRVIYTFSVNH